MARAFVAVRPPHAVLDAIAARVSDLPFGDGARLTGRAQWHITVQFLGDDCDVDQVATALPGLMIGAAEVQLGPPAPLGNSTRAKVCALAARGGDWWRDLAAVVAAQLRPLGVQPDSRPYG